MSENKLRILVTGAGGIAGVNFVRSLRNSDTEFFIVGTDFNKYHLEFPQVDKRIRTPRHSDPGFIDLIKKIVSDNDIDFVHPQPASEAKIIAKHRHELNAEVFLPDNEILTLDKLETQKILKSKNIAVAKTETIESTNDVKTAFEKLGQEKIWVRAKDGAGGRLSLLCNNPEEAELWIKLWIKKGQIEPTDFMLQEYLSGRNISCDSLWNREIHSRSDGLINGFTRERLEYPFKHISPSGITGTPTVSRIIEGNSSFKLGLDAIKAIDPRPHGSYAVDIKEDKDGKPYVTEIDSGKFHTTTPLWGYAYKEYLKNTSDKNENPKWYDHYNLAWIYTMMAMKVETNTELHEINQMYEYGIHLLRHMDSGVWLWKENNYKLKIL
ncbi:MAG: hypothetical protein VX368_03110 [Thermoproteota archaeon]